MRTLTSMPYQPPHTHINKQSFDIQSKEAISLLIRENRSFLAFIFLSLTEGSFLGALT